MTSDDDDDCTTHISKSVGLAWCGETLTSLIWAFTSIDHAANSNLHGSRLLPCPNCVKKVVKALRMTGLEP